MESYTATLGKMTKIVAVAYIITVALILLLALIMNRFDLGDSWISMGTNVIMIVSTFVAGVITGKVFRTRKWLHGMLVGALYFIILTIISMAYVKDGMMTDSITYSFIICFCSTTLGAMVS